jgi:hypothetical protein
MKPIYIGTYTLGYFNVELFINPESSSARFDASRTGKTGRMELGASKPFRNQEALLDLLLHETFEVAALNLDLRYERHGNNSSQDMLFVFTHEQFNRVCRMQAGFISEALPHLMNAFNKLKK